MFDIFLHCLEWMTTVTIYWDIAMQLSQFFSVWNVRVSLSMLTPVSFVSVSEIDFFRCFCVQDLCIHCRWSGMWYFIVEMGCDKNIWCSKIIWCILNCIFCDHGFVVMCYHKYLRCWVQTANVAVPRIDRGGAVVHGNVQTKWRQSKQVLSQIVDVWGKYEVVPCYNRD